MCCYGSSGEDKRKKAVPKIIKNLKHKDDKVKAIAAMMLGEIGDERAIDPLLENFELMVLEFGQSPLAKIGAPALPKLIKVAKEKVCLDFCRNSREKTEEVKMQLML